jgi:uncharacterized protein (DUF2235 family)
MKRLVVLFDGTWNTLQNPDEATNVVRVGQAVKPVARDGVTQVVYYNSGVGSGGVVDQILGGVFGAGVKSNVKRGLTFLSFNYNSGEKDFDSGETYEQIPDEIYIFGFSRGAYTARALAGVIGSIGGIPKVSKFGEVEKLWAHYRKSEEGQAKNREKIKDLVYTVPAGRKPIKCVAVWDTVGSYGIPTGLGLSSLARMITSWTRNFRDNRIGRRIEYGFHAMAIDERRRAFSATAWVPRQKKKNQEAGQAGQPKLPDPIVEQVWFAGAHANVGGGYKQTGLSDQALIWMISRVQDKTKLDFDEDYISNHFLPCSACSAFRSDKGWWLSSLWPYVRSIPKAMTNAAGTGDAEPGPDAILDGRVHWSVKERRGRLSLVDQDRYRKYAPKNLADDVVYTEHNPTEDRLISLCHANQANEKRQHCALRRDLEGMDGGWWRWWRRSRARRMRRFRENWKDLIAGHSS